MTAKTAAQMTIMSVVDIGLPGGGGGGVGVASEEEDGSVEVVEELAGSVEGEKEGVDIGASVAAGAFGFVSSAPEAELSAVRLPLRGASGGRELVVAGLRCRSKGGSMGREIKGE